MNERNVLAGATCGLTFSRRFKLNIRGEIKMTTKDFSYLEFKQSDKVRELKINNAIES